MLSSLLLLRFPYLFLPSTEVLNVLGGDPKVDRKAFSSGSRERVTETCLLAPTVHTDVGGGMLPRGGLKMGRVAASKTLENSPSATVLIMRRA